MHMSFWWDTDIEDLLFKGLNIKSTCSLLVTCVVLVLFGIFFEWLKLLQMKQRQKELLIRAIQIRSICPTNETSSLLFSRRQSVTETPGNLTRIGFKVWDALLWINMQVLGYTMMLLIMLYNGWLVISLLAGSAIGFCIFGPIFIKINIQNGQIVRDAFCYFNCKESETNNEINSNSLPSTSTSTTSPNQDEVSVCVHSKPQEMIT
ncbi:hypothetical protein FQR65_LT03355 [Abscondita terminalis]|nr:hypothetical protein FQR65_LT03355 [Abscondita terminalis]